MIDQYPKFDNISTMIYLFIFYLIFHGSLNLEFCLGIS